MAKYKMILDLDTGIDDALALAYALATPECDLIGVVASFGNIVPEEAAQNTLNLLEMLGHPEIPVFIGARHSSHTDSFEAMPISATIHGNNGVGNVDLPTAKRQLEEQNGIDFYIEAAHKYQGRLLIVPTGPLTNFAAAIEKDPEIIDLIGRVTLMGGALTVPGNVNAVTEANINQDPPAANKVLRSNLPITMVGLDVTLRTLLTRKETQEWREIGTTSATKYADIVDHYIDAYKITSPHLHGCGLHDPLAVAAAVDPSILQTIYLNMKVDVDGPYAGRTIGDETRLNEPANSTQVAVNVDVDRFLEMFMNKLTELFKQN